MPGFRGWLAGLTIVCGLSQTVPQLTTIQDVLYNADGTRFNGLLTISWQSFDAADSSNIVSHVLNVPVTNGYLYVQLVPTTNVNPQLVYTVKYSGDAGVQFTETWAVPPSPTPLRVRDVRVPAGAGSVVGPPAQTAIGITDVTGLQNELSIRPVMGPGYTSSRAAMIDALGALDGVIGNSSDCVHVDGTSGTCGAAGGSGPVAFVDNEAPAGTMDGSNAAFTLGNTPNPSSSLSLYRNGMLLSPALDYALAGNTITFQSGKQPQPGDILLGSYRVGASIPGVGFVDNEVPAGTVDGANAVFTTAQAPNPTTSLALYRNGLRLKLNLDYTLSAGTITFGAGLAPQLGDTLLCFYRVAQ